MGAALVLVCFFKPRPSLSTISSLNSPSAAVLRNKVIESFFCVHSPDPNPSSNFGFTVRSFHCPDDFSALITAR